MLCDDCRERPANVHVTKINNNHKVERHLCDACAQKTGEISFSTDTQFAVQDFLKGMLSHGFAGFPRSEAAARCPNCRMTFEDFSRSGKIGCSVCYDSFSDRLNPMLHRIHGTAGHTGKIPKRCGGALALRQRLKQLRQELEHFVSREEYEQAAKIRDDIKALEKELNIGG